MKTIIAVDPGKSGGIAVEYQNGFIALHKMPETQGDVIKLICEIRDRSDEVVAVMEQVGGFTGKGQPGSAMFKFGQGYGFMLGAFAMGNIPLWLVTPNKWQKTFGVGIKGKQTTTVWKNKLKSLAQRIYPELNITLATSDALLILEYYKKL